MSVATVITGKPGLEKFIGTFRSARSFPAQLSHRVKKPCTLFVVSRK